MGSNLTCYSTIWPVVMMTATVVTARQAADAQQQRLAAIAAQIQRMAGGHSQPEFSSPLHFRSPARSWCPRMLGWRPRDMECFLTSWTVPNTCKQLQRFLGFTNRRFIWNNSSITALLTTLTFLKVTFLWTLMAERLPDSQSPVHISTHSPTARLSSR